MHLLLAVVGQIILSKILIIAIAHFKLLMVHLLLRNLNFSVDNFDVGGLPWNIK